MAHSVILHLPLIHFFLTNDRERERERERFLGFASFNVCHIKLVINMTLLRCFLLFSTTSSLVIVQSLPESFSWISNFWNQDASVGRQPIRSGCTYQGTPATKKKKVGPRKWGKMEWLIAKGKSWNFDTWSHGLLPSQTPRSGTSN